MANKRTVKRREITLPGNFLSAIDGETASKPSSPAGIAQTWLTARPASEESKAVNDPIAQGAHQVGRNEERGSPPSTHWRSAESVVSMVSSPGGHHLTPTPCRANERPRPGGKALLSKTGGWRRTRRGEKTSQRDPVCARDQPTSKSDEV